MENSTLLKPVKVQFNDLTVPQNLQTALKVTPEEWDQLNAERKSILDIFKGPFIDGALRGDKKPPFTKAEVMSAIQEGMSQQGILLLATEAIGNILQDALDAAAQMSQGKDPLEALLKQLMQGAPNPNNSEGEQEG